MQTHQLNLDEHRNFILQTKFKKYVNLDLLLKNGCGYRHGQPGKCVSRATFITHSRKRIALSVTRLRNYHS